jgi:hypothetical protein
MKPFAVLMVFNSIFLSAVSPQSECQTSPQTQQVPAQKTPVAEKGSSHFGVGVKLSSLGLGVERAVLVSERSNLRAGFNVLGFSHTFTKDGISYDGHLNFKTFEAHYDFFPWAGRFHVSPGVLIYAADPIKANAFIPGNHTFTLGGVRFYSDPSNPATAQGRINFNRAAPTITVGWGNLISRKEGSRFSFPFEIGIAIQGNPKTSLAFGGNVCAAPGTFCSSAITDAAVQSNIASEENKINNNLSALKVYPIISGGFGFRF